MPPASGPIRLAMVLSMPDVLAKPQAPWALRLVPPFPSVATRILHLVNREDVSTQEIGALIKLDPSFTAEVLRLANSALFGVSRQVSNLSHAVVLMGLDRVKALATFVALNKMVRSAVKVEALRKCWKHSLVTAMLSDGAAMSLGFAQDSAYTAGLLHNLGTLGMMSAYPDEYARMLEVSNDFGFDLLKTERDLFEIDHCAAGAYLAQDWDFPDEIAAVLATHHDPPVPGERSLDNIVKIAWRLADTLGYAAFSPDRPWTYDELIEILPLANRSWFGRGEKEAMAEIEARLAAVLV